MARYAENLIGDWEKDQYEPLREVAQLQYNTNWDKLTNDFNRLNEQLAQNFKNARIEHNKALIDNAQNSYMRLYNAEQDLAKRGLTGSGLMNVYNAANTAQTGEENSKILKSLMEANKATMEGSLSGLDKYSRGVADLAGDLGDRLAGITDAEGDNLRQYANLVASINESAAERADSYSRANAEKSLADEQDDIYQFLAIKDILSDDETDDETKYYDLIKDAAVTPEQAERILSSYNYNKTSTKLEDKKSALAKTEDNIRDYLDSDLLINKIAYSQPFTTLPRALGLTYNLAKNTRNKNDVKKLERELSKYTYEDLKDIMGY